MPRALAFLVLPLLLATLNGCKGPCRELSEKLCDCQQLSPQQKTNCKSRVGQRESQIDLDSADETVCEGYLGTCGGCNTLETDEGKRACGLARSP